jgi:hypothetical protein
MPYSDRGREAGEDLFKEALPELFKTGKAGFMTAENGGMTKFIMDDDVRMQVLTVWMELVDYLGNTTHIATPDEIEEGFVRLLAREDEPAWTNAVRGVFNTAFGEGKVDAGVTHQKELMPILKDESVSKKAITDLIDDILDWMRNRIDAT